MVLLLLSVLVALATVSIFRRQFAGVGGLTFSGFDGIGVVSGFIIITTGAVALGPEFGIPLLLALLLHELGQVLGYRMLGHSEACFRLVPCISGRKNSELPLKTDGEAFLAAIMGPAFGLAPMAIAMALAAALANSQPEISNWLWILGVTIGAINFVSLLPFFPLNGGHCTATAVKNFWPALAPAMTAFMCAAFVSASFRTGSVTLLVMAGIGARGFWLKMPAGRTEMPADVGLVALAAYAFTMAAHFSAGWLLFQPYF